MADLNFVTTWRTTADARAFLATRRGPFYLLATMPTRTGVGSSGEPSHLALRAMVTVTRAALYTFLDSIEAGAKWQDMGDAMIAVTTEGRDTLVGATYS